MAISDQARAFWDRISPRERRLVVILGVAAPITIAIWLGLSIRDGLDAMERRNDKTRKALDTLAVMRAKGPTHTPDNDPTATMGTEPLDLDSYITNAAKKAKFELKSTITPHPKQERNNFVTTSSSLTIDKLTMDQVRDFLFELESESKLVAVTHLELKRDFREKDKLTINLDVSSYSKKAEDKPAAGSGAGSAAPAADTKKGS